MPQNIDLARISAYQQDRAGIRVDQKSQSYLSKRGEHFQGCTRQATDDLLSSWYSYGSLKRTHNGEGLRE